jgi:hypothetical protein
MPGAAAAISQSGVESFVVDGKARQGLVRAASVPISVMGCCWSPIPAAV